jgi:lipoprotein-releasing system ATP-binding protein
MLQNAEIVSDRSGLVVVDLRKSFDSPVGKRFDVLRGVSLNAKAGESIAITGASGSGKSTLLQLLGGLDKSDHGNISLNGIELDRINGNALSLVRQKEIGYIFQFHYLLQDLTALENVTLPLLISRQKKDDAVKRARSLLREVGLLERLDSPVSHLSGGEQQRVAVARALARNPGLLLADEPTGNLDNAISEEVALTLINYTRSNSTITLIATHNQHLASLCDRRFVLEQGRLQPI